MNVYEIRGGFGLDNLTRTEREDPRPGPGEVLIEVRAASLNRRDLLMVEGTYNPKQPLPLVPLSDGAGVVLEVGPGVTRVRPGDRVAGLFCQRWVAGQPDRDDVRVTLGGPLDGMLRERAVLPEGGVARIPAHLSFEEAATLPCAALTAWSALVTLGRVKAGDTVLVLGTGGVSVFALQFARLLGARVIATSSSEEKLEHLKRLGAEHVVNYRETPGWGRVVRELTSGLGVDHVVEVGGAGTFNESVRALRIGGTMSLIGVLAGAADGIQLTPVFMSHIKVQGVFVGHRKSFEAMCRAIEAHGMRPVLDEVFAFEEAKGAFERMAAGAHFGKIGVRVT